MSFRSISIRAAGALAAAVVAIGVPTLAVADSYKVKFAKGREDGDGLFRRAEVEARLTPASGVIGLFRAWDATGLLNGWTTFVDGVSAVDAAGKPLTLEPGTGGRWTVRGWTSGEITVRYAVLLQHDRFPSRIGDGEAAYARPYGVSWTGRALLMEGAPSRDVIVEFDIPEGWKMTTPWARTSPANWTFRARNTDDLLDSAFIAGDYRESVVPLGGFEARLAVSPKAAAAEPIFRETFQTYLAAYGRLFGAGSAVEPPVVIAVEASYWSAGVMGRSINILMGGEIDDNTRPLLDYVIAHEGFHLWNVKWFAGEDHPDLEWLAEGAAEYYTWLTGLRAGRVTEEAFLAEAARRAALYRNRLEGGSLAAAGKIKGGSPETYDRVYTGGMVALAALDMTIRRNTRGRKSLDDLVRDIHAAHARPGVAGLTEAELAQRLSETYGVDGADFLRRHIHGQEPLPLEALYAGLGLKLTYGRDKDGVTASLARSPAATPAQRRVFAAYAAGAPGR